MIPTRLLGAAAALVLVLSACSGGSGYNSSPDDDDGSDTESTPRSESSNASDQAQFATFDKLVSALRLSGCVTADGEVAEVATRPDESVACGDTVEVDWYEDKADLDQARSEIEDQICTEVDGEWSYLVGDQWTLTVQLPTEPGSDDSALAILAQRGGAGEIETYNC